MRACLCAWACLSVDRQSHPGSLDAFTTTIMVDFDDEAEIVAEALDLDDLEEALAAVMSDDDEAENDAVEEEAGSVLEAEPGGELVAVEAIGEAEAPVGIVG